MACADAEKRGVSAWALIVGEGSERARMESYCKEHGISNVTLTGFVNQTRVPHLFAASDALAMISEMEPHALVVTEGASFGLPIIISDRVGCIGPNDTARPDVNALVYRCGDTTALCDKIVSLASDPDLYARLSRESIEISKGQDVAVAARALADASRELRDLGPRKK